MEAKIKIKKWVNGEPWSHGMVTLGNGKVFTFHMKHFENPSQFGIDDGRISKLDVRTEATGKPVIHFDRGWDITRARATTRRSSTRSRRSTTERSIRRRRRTPPRHTRKENEDGEEE